MIRFNRPHMTGKEMQYMTEAVERGKISGDGVFTQKCHAFLQDTLGVKKVLLTTSCTDALEMSALLLNLQPGDEVIVPAFTFVSTVNAFLVRGATPVFIDVRPDTLNLDETLLESKITPRTRAVVPVHYGGVACEMNAIVSIANHHNILVIEDNAHGLFATYYGQYLGTFGALATQSFHETKNFHCGEGGALLINAERFIERAEIIREKGTDRSRFFRGQVDKYTWVDVGSSFLPSDLLAAFLFAQFEHKDQIQKRRHEIWSTYYTGLSDWAAAQDVQLPVVPAHCHHSAHLFYLLLPTLESRDRFISFLRDRGVQTVFHYLPLHLSKMGRQLGGQPGMCPVTESVSDRLVRLPFYNDLTPSDQARVIEAIQTFTV
ncbi:MAG: dTDP-4-amino-4,6-dideoxygalactose transaminase [Gemmatimonadetes bacterium]|nr:MAG: dTDP-4-amino-4,6-dideoxygalactose transaminase [Gemmatimonadota bacterium]